MFVSRKGYSGSNYSMRTIEDREETSHPPIHGVKSSRNYSKPASINNKDRAETRYTPAEISENSKPLLRMLIYHLWNIMTNPTITSEPGWKMLLELCTWRIKVPSRCQMTQLDTYGTPLKGNHERTGWCVKDRNT